MTLLSYKILFIFHSCGQAKASQQPSTHLSLSASFSISLTVCLFLPFVDGLNGRVANKGRKAEREMKYILTVLWKNNLTQSNIHLQWIQYSFWNDIRRYLLYLPLCSHLPFSGSKLCALVRKWANACLYLAGYMPWIYSLLQEVIGNYSGHLGNHCLSQIHVILKNN